jgi:hypothetical protein
MLPGAGNPAGSIAKRAAAMKPTTYPGQMLRNFPPSKLCLLPLWSGLAGILAGYAVILFLYHIEFTSRPKNNAIPSSAMQYVQTGRPVMLAGGYNE